MTQWDLRAESELPIRIASRVSTIGQGIQNSKGVNAPKTPSLGSNLLSVAFAAVNLSSRHRKRESKKLTRQSMIADFVPGAQFSGATWRDTVNNSLRRKLKPVSVFGQLCENMTSSTKLEVHNVLHCCQRRTEPRP